MQNSVCAGRRIRPHLAALLPLWLLAITPPLFSQYKYRVVDLGDFTPVVVNNLGHVAGTAIAPGSSFTHAVLYKNGTLAPLGALGATASSVGGMNNYGDIVGIYTAANNSSRAYIYRDQTMVDLWPATTGNTAAFDINDAGHIAGGIGFERVLYANGVFTTIPGSPSTVAAINLHDEITGTVNTSPIFSGFLYSGGKLTYIFQRIIPSGMNNRGEIVGNRNDAPAGVSAFHYASGVLTRLKDLPGTQGSVVWAINNAGLMVGLSGDTSQPNSRALLWQNGEPIDLNTLVDLGASTFTTLTSALSISDRNVIAGRGVSKQGELRAFLLEPITTSAPQPPWWTARGVIDPIKTAVDYATANQGQVKQLAKKAYDELEARLPGGAGPELTSVISNWSNTAAARDFAVLNIGQLKSLAKLFYDRLAQVGYHGPPLSAGQVYPWSSSTSDDSNFAAANIGQVKHLFSFDLGGSNTDSDTDNLPDWWERWHFGNTAAQNASGDPDADGLTNAQEYSAGTNPTMPTS